MARRLVRWFDLIRLKNSVCCVFRNFVPISFGSGANLNQLRKFSTELEFKHSSMIVFREAAGALKEQIPKNTPLLVDRTAIYMHQD